MIKKILFAIVVTSFVSVSADTYLVTLDDKFYENRIVIKDPVNNGGNSNLPYDQTKGYTGYTLTYTDRYENIHSIDDYSTLNDLQCKDPVGSGLAEVCVNGGNNLGVSTNGKYGYLTFDLGGNNYVSQIMVDAGGSVNQNKGSGYRISYQDLNDNWIDTGIEVGNNANCYCTYQKVVDINAQVKQIKATVVRYGYKEGSATLGEFRILN